MNELSVESADKAKEFERILKQLVALYTEFSVMSGKKPTEIINLFKFRILNEYISLANNFLGDGSKPIQFFKLFEETDLPNASDIVVVLRMYLEALYDWWRARSESTGYGAANWIVKGKSSNVRCEIPKRPWKD